MELQGTFSGYITKCQTKADKKNDGAEVWVDAEVYLSQQEAEKLGGEDFEHVAFGDMHQAIDQADDGDATVTRFGYSKKKAPKWMKMSVHHADLWGVVQRCQPEILNFVAGNNEEAVTVQLRFKFNANRDVQTLGTLAAACGESRKINLKAIQMQLPLKKPDATEEGPLPDNVRPLSTAQKRNKALPPVKAKAKPKKKPAAKKKTAKKKAAKKKSAAPKGNSAAAPV